MKNAIVIGRGMVGNATMKSLGIEKYISKNKNNVEGEAITYYKYIFICLPTPTIDGDQDLSVIEEYLKLISLGYRDNVVIIRSTVLPETCGLWSKKYNMPIVHVPEFLTESTWESDCVWPDIVVIGADEEEIRNEVAGIFKARFKGASYFLTDTITSETIKYAINTFYATKVIFANQIFDISNKIGANYETIKKALYSRKWIGKNHLDIWHNGGRGAGGKCLLKDLSAFSKYSQLPLLKVANELNKGLVVKYPKNEN
jgi:nucleotide sugar dehydrogenase